MSASKTAIRLVANQGRVSGGEVMLLRLARQLRELGREVTVVAPRSPSETAELLEDAGFAVERLPGRSRRAYMLSLRRWHPRSTVDVTWCNGLLPAVALSGRARRVLHLHQLPAGPLQAVLSRIARLGAVATVVPSEWMSERLPGSTPLPNWVEAAPQEAEPQGSSPRAEAPLRVGFLGRLSPNKGILDLLRAGELLEQGRPGGIELLIAGDRRFVPSAQAEQIQRRLDAAGERVRLLGWIPKEELFQRIDLLAVPSDWSEVFGLAAAEAMAARVPVIVSDAGALPEVVGRDHPLIARAGDPESLAAAIRRAEQLDAEELVGTQHQRWVQHWSPEAGRRRLQRFLMERGI
ncbi:hypothetical protein GCM10009594_22390 [Kocuria palustris]|uniref:glycosyltransferase family 4 protein n=1 Tax=Kocuria palustris TaxID=71999 RepID=UPI0030B8C94D|nr:glycosyltransferase involved in cell wall biosynthesis [Kocuria palustris]